MSACLSSALLIEMVDDRSETTMSYGSAALEDQNVAPALLTIVKYNLYHYGENGSSQKVTGVLATRQLSK
jgi:hypothetical protein